MRTKFYETTDLGVISLELVIKLISGSENERVDIKPMVTKLFRDLFLTPFSGKFIDNDRQGFSNMHMLISFVDEDEIAKHIKSLPYPDFLKTAYWIFTAKGIRYDADYWCKYCNIRSPGHILDVHHESYDNHGYEATKGTNDLVCLCRKCHKQVHSIDGN